MAGVMKSTIIRSGYRSKRADDRKQTSSSHADDGKGHRSVKRKVLSAAFELPSQVRKPDNTLGASQNRQLGAFERKSLSDPLQVYGDCDESNCQHRSSSGLNPSDCKDRLPKGLQGRHDAPEGAENLSLEKRSGLKPGLKDSTNLDPRVALKQNNLHMYNEVLVLKEALCAEKEARRAVQAELEEERNAASSAANETMSMIARLQEEKAVVVMEARQFKRMAEERDLHNQEAISLLKEMLMSKEEEALALENELLSCRQVGSGEHAQKMNLKYLDVESYSKRNQGTELLSCGSEMLSLYANGLSGTSLEEDIINSEFNGRAFGRSLKASELGSIRGNLEDFFNQAGDVTEEMGHCNDIQCKEEFSGMMYEKVLDVSMGADVQGSPGFIHGAVHGIGNGDDCDQLFLPALGDASSECQAERPLACCTDEQSRSLWDRIMKLEHRLETLGVDAQDFEFNFPRNVASTPQTPAFTPCDQHVNARYRDTISPTMLKLQEVESKKTETAERPRKLQCNTGHSNGCEEGMRQLKGLEFSLCKNQLQASSEWQGMNTSEPCEISWDMVEGVHDVFEVSYESNLGPPSECYISPMVDRSPKDQLASMEKPDSPDSPLELMAPVMETMAVTPPDSEVVGTLSSSLCGTEVQQLSKCMQVLESEKHSMHQAFLSLQAENNELRMLQGVGFQLLDLKQSQNLKRSLQISEQPNKRVKSEQSSFTSILKGFFSYFPSGNNLENCSMVRDLASGSSPTKDYVGLSHLLENSHVKTEALVMRGLKIKVPAAI